MPGRVSWEMLLLTGWPVLSRPSSLMEGKRSSLMGGSSVSSGRLMLGGSIWPKPGWMSCSAGAGLDELVTVERRHRSASDILVAGVFWVWCIPGLDGPEALVEVLKNVARAGKY